MRPAQRIALAGLALVVGAQSARGSPGFPRVVQETLNLSYHPGCTLCHGLGKTGFGTVTTTFGMAMLDLGAIAANDLTIRDALESLQAQNSPLISDLIAGRDPNQADPNHGCSSSAAPSSLSSGVTYLSLLLLWLALRNKKGSILRKSATQQCKNQTPRSVHQRATSIKRFAYAVSSCISRCFARWSRDATVPSGTSNIRAISACENPSITNNRNTLRWPAGRSDSA